MGLPFCNGLEEQFFLQLLIDQVWNAWKAFGEASKNGVGLRRQLAEESGRNPVGRGRRMEALSGGGKGRGVCTHPGPVLSCPGNRSL